MERRSETETTEYAELKAKYAVDYMLRCGFLDNITSQDIAHIKWMIAAYAMDVVESDRKRRIHNTNQG